MSSRRLGSLATALINAELRELRDRPTRTAQPLPHFPAGQMLMCVKVCATAKTSRIGSPGWTRTTNPPVNSRMLCQLSYRGLLGVREDIGAERVLTLAYRRTHAQPDRPPAGRRMVVAMGQDGCTPTNLERDRFDPLRRRAGTGLCDGHKGRSPSL